MIQNKVTRNLPPSEYNAHRWLPQSSTLETLEKREDIVLVLR